MVVECVYPNPLRQSYSHRLLGQRTGRLAATPIDGSNEKSTQCTGFRLPRPAVQFRRFPQARFVTSLCGHRSAHYVARLGSGRDTPSP